MTKSQKLGEGRGLVILWQRFNLARRMRESKSRRLSEAVCSGRAGRRKRRKIHEIREAGVRVGKGDTGGTGIERIMESDIGTDQEVQTGIFIGADAMRERSGGIEVEVEARIGGTEDTGATARIAEGMKERIVNQDGMVVEDPDGVDPLTLAAAGEVTVNLKTICCLSKEFGVFRQDGQQSMEVEGSRL